MYKLCCGNIDGGYGEEVVERVGGKGEGGVVVSYGMGVECI